MGQGSSVQGKVTSYWKCAIEISLERQEDYIRKEVLKDGSVSAEQFREAF